MWVVPLESRPDSPSAEMIGGKAAGLQRLINAGFRVPHGYVVTTEAYKRSLSRVLLGLKTPEEMKKAGHEGHIDGKQLLHGMRDYGCRLFGYLGRAVFNEWGITKTADFGEIVFRLVDAQPPGHRRV